MDEINKWKNMYKKQESKPLRLDKLIERLNRIERDTKKSRYLLITGAIVLTATALIRLSEFENMYYVYAFLLIMPAISLKLYLLYKGKYDTINNEAEFNNQNFIKNHLSKLKEKLAFEKKHLVVFLILLTLGMNCALLGTYDKGTIFNFEFNEDNRIYIHLSTIVVFFVGFYVNSKKMARYKNNILELIKELETITAK